MLPGLFAYPNFPYLPTHCYIEEIVKVHFLNLTQIKPRISTPPHTNPTQKGFKKYIKCGCYALMSKRELKVTQTPAQLDFFKTVLYSSRAAQTFNTTPMKTYKKMTRKLLPFIFSVPFPLSSRICFSIFFFICSLAFYSFLNKLFRTYVKLLSANSGRHLIWYPFPYYFLSPKPWPKSQKTYTKLPPQTPRETA